MYGDGRDERGWGGGKILVCLFEGMPGAPARGVNRWVAHARGCGVQVVEAVGDGVLHGSGACHMLHACGKAA